MRDAVFSQLSPLERERWALGYAHPSDADFARNQFTDRLDPDDKEGAEPAPKVTFYAQPMTAAAPVSSAAVAAWLDPNARRYPPLPGEIFVPPRKRGIVAGVLAYGEGETRERFTRFLAVRRTGSVEYAAYCSWWAERAEAWILSVKQVVAQFAQLLSFLDDLATTFALPREWTVFCNARNASSAWLTGFGAGWAGPFVFLRETTRCLDRHFQLEVNYRGDAASLDAVVREFAERFDLAFGSTTPRAFDRVGDGKGTISYGGVTYP